MGPPTMIVVWNPKSQSMFVHKFVNELLNLEKLLLNNLVKYTGGKDTWDQWLHVENIESSG